MASPFEQLAKQAPVLDAEAEQRAKQARRIQLQQQLAQVQPQPGMSATRAAQAVAPTAAAQFGEAALGTRQQSQQLQAQVGQLAQQQQAQREGAALAAAGTRQQEQLAGKSIEQATAEQTAERQQKVQFTKEELAQQKRLQSLGLDYNNQISFLTRQQREDLARIGGDVKDQIFDSRLQFARDEAGRKFTNERQLSDFAVATATSQQDLLDKMQSMEMAARKEMIMYEVAHKKLKQELEQNWKSMDAGKRREYQEALAEIEKSLKDSIHKLEMGAANKEMMIAGGSAIGGVVGAIMGSGTGVGAVGGAVIGSAAGGAIGYGVAESGAV